MHRPRKNNRQRKKKSTESKSFLQKKDLERIKRSISTTNQISSTTNATEPSTATDISRSRGQHSTSCMPSAAVQRKALERKLKIKQIEEERKKKKAELSEMELEQEELKKNTRKLAIQQRDEDNEIVRKMNSMLLKAKCASIRDRQLREKSEQLSTEKETEEMWHQSMDRDRLQDLESRKQKEIRRHEATMEDAQMVQKQIAEKDHLRIIEQERKANEGEELLKQLKNAEEMDKLKELKKEDVRRKMQEEIDRVNERATEIKRQRIQFEKEEEAKIAKYIREKDARDAEMERLKEETHARREKESADLRAKQQRALDNRGQLDEIRARRAQEQKERAWRKQQLEKAKIKKKMGEDMQRARTIQLKYKETRMAEAIQEQKLEYTRMMETLKQNQEQTKKNQKQEQTLKETYHHELLQQISDNCEKRRVQTLEDKAGFLVENKEAMRLKLEKVKERTLNEMKALGIPSEYQIELERYQIRY